MKTQDLGTKNGLKERGFAIPIVVAVIALVLIGLYIFGAFRSTPKPETIIKDTVPESMFFPETETSSTTSTSTDVESTTTSTTTNPTSSGEEN